MVGAVVVMNGFSMFPLEAEGREDGERGGAVEQLKLADDLVFAEERERESELVLGGVADEGEACVVCLSALAGGGLALNRREVRGVLRLGEQTQHARELERAQVGLVGRRERGEVRHVVAHVLDSRDQHQVFSAPITKRVYIGLQKIFSD